MTANGQPPHPLSLKQRIDPARVAQLEQQTSQQAQLLVTRALNDVSNLANALQFLTEQANAGNPTARQVLGLYFAKLDLARAASAGIAVPHGAAPPGS